MIPKNRKEMSPANGNKNLKKMKVDRVRANHSLRLTASQGTSNIPFHYQKTREGKGRQISLALRLNLAPATND